MSKVNFYNIPVNEKSMIYEENPPSFDEIIKELTTPEASD
jgi:hypothetical protein